MLVRNKGKYFVILLTFTFSEIKKRRQRQTGTEEEMEVLDIQMEHLLGTDDETENLYNSDNKNENQQGKTYVGQVQTDCFCQVNILDRQTNPNFN